ncbi:MAG: HEPN domain-containing protein [Elusimicrobia bacterium]|nr:HEPN domain-containing protein [Elusimicrobiota bacterium]
MKKLTMEWIKKAEGDYLVAKREFKSTPPVYEAVCFHAQQCIEKYMKAVLQENNIEFEKTHDLGSLLEQCKSFIPQLAKYHMELLEVSSFAVEVRYPGLEVTKDETEKAILIMNKIRKISYLYFKM